MNEQKFWLKSKVKTLLNILYLLEKEIAGEWHVLNLQAKSFERLGLGALMRDLSTEVIFGEGLEGINGNLDKEKA